ncbi:Trm112 family protein [Dissulfurirhabdus thermomarina]|uniref:UPF0434 protein G3N55_02045 n=1 Tax=Dissulfurirhabdus thermomarina TaxID=1765737 RepID=A0A6N9TPG8_DISTH|nr:Trm112 family protein [Dissulfurirhabdus thermomarina]NDY41634.1 Trm112 family protein [Dissulfurirhabdus thermomarina]NMX23323.1 Trm112 family protein [Dissulfurirhabdus thermomarina]
MTPLGISEELLEILACPACKGPVVPSEADSALVCRRCRLAYEVRDGIPVMLVEEARPLEGEAGDDA